MTSIEVFKSRFSVVLTQSVIWGDMDAFQHINNTVYFRYFENVRLEYFERVGINQLMQTEKIGPILGSTECKYLVPLSFPDEITIGTNVTQVRDKRFTMHYEVFSNKLSKIASTGSGEIIYFDYNINKTTKIPNIILGQIDKLSC